MLAKLPTHRTALLDAAALIEKHGLAKHTRCGESGSLCVHGAVSMAATGGDPSRGAQTNDPSMMLLASYIRSQEPNAIVLDNGGCAYWNNRPERTAAEVISALQNAATWNI